MRRRAPPIPVALAANLMNCWWRPGIPPLTGPARDLFWNHEPTRVSLWREREGNKLASIFHSERPLDAQTERASSDRRQTEGPQDTPERNGNTSEGESTLKPFEYHYQWEYRFEENYQGKGWTNIDIPPPEDGLLGDDPDLPSNSQEKAWMCKRKHPAGDYVMSGQRKSCVGCGGTKPKVLDRVMTYNIRWPMK